jgi:tetratricopeptide (TPR) repeat protein
VVEQSVVPRRVVRGSPRFGLLHVVREFALERLEESSEAEALRRAHASYHVALAEREVAAYDDDDADFHIERLEAEQDNLRAALAWLRARAEAAGREGKTRHARAGRVATRRGAETPAAQGLRLAGALLWPWAERGHLAEGRAWVEAFLALNAPATGDHAEPDGATSPAARHRGSLWTARAVDEASVHARALYAAGVLAYWQGDSAQAVAPLEQSVDLFEAAGRRTDLGLALNNLGMALADRGEVARARACYERCLALGRELDVRRLIALPLHNLGALMLAVGDTEQAAAYSAEALAIGRQDHAERMVGWSLIVQAMIARRRGESGRAASMAKEALVLLCTSTDMRDHVQGLEAYAIMCATRGRAERAARLLGAAAASRERVGMRRPMTVPTADDIEAAVVLARAVLGEERWVAAYAEGRALTLEEAVAEALGEEA